MAAEPVSAPMVLMYHSVEPYTSDPYHVTVRPERFDRQLRWLRRRGLRGTSMRELLRSGPDRRLVGLTFDDGYADFVSHVMPVLARYGFTATVFVIAGALGGANTWDHPGPRKFLMTADEVRYAAGAGIEIGSHSLTHQRLPDAGERVLADEVRGSRAILSELVGEDVDGFCYPYGAAGAREVDAVRAAGYGYACAVRPPVPGDRYAIPRAFIGDRDTSPRLFAKWARYRLTTRRVAPLAAVAATAGGAR
jgi:peptidoglycan/xylan/chitin deacetylase (PgdA/CDA1 family)